MRKGGLGIHELRGGVGIAVEGEDAASFKSVRGHRMVEVLPGRISIDFDRDASLGRRFEHRAPIGDDTCAGSGDATARMGENPNCRMGDGGEHPVGLILVPSEPRMRRGQDDVERRRFFLGEIQPANGVDVRFDALQQPELIAASGVHLLDGAPLSVASAIDIPPAIFKSV